MKVISLRVGLMAILMSLGTARSTYAQSQSFQYRCARNRTFQATFSPEQAIVNLDDGRTLLMRQIVSASGAIYKNAGYILSTKGNEAFITLNDQMIYQNCLTRSINSTSGAILNFQTEKHKVRVYRLIENAITIS